MMMNFFLKRVTPAFFCVFIFLAVSGCAKHPEGERGMVSEQALVFDEPQYVGSEKCKDCHWREHDSWKHTLHSRFAQAPDDFTVAGDFTRNNKLSTKIPAEAPQLAGQTITTTMHMKEDGRYYVNTLGPDWRPHDYEVISVLGVNMRQNYLTRFPNGAIHVLPVEWNVKEKAWTDYYGLEKRYPGDGNYWSDPGRMWQFRCGGCHVTGLKINYDGDKDTFNTEWAELGIGCEACHGPANNHVKAAREYYEKEKETITNPSKLPWRLRAMVCGQCHSRGKSTAKISPRKEGFPEHYDFAYGYLPGKSLYLYSEVSVIEKPSELRDVHQQYNEWEKSVHSERGIMCSSCHGVHQEGAHLSPNKSQTKLPADNLCKSCHTSVVRRGPHKIHTFGSCIDCHMPKLYGDLRNHKFEFVSPELSLQAGGVKYQPNSCSGCHHHKDTPLEDLVEFLDAAKKRDMPMPFSAHGR